jgi:hypothetical protein
MNERIKELYNQAQEHHKSKNMALEEVNYEKFAELIIKECAKVGASVDIGACIVESKIKQHFGVK